MKNIIIASPCRAGKSTLARKINEELNFFVVSVEALSQAKDFLPLFSPGLAEKLLGEFARLSTPTETADTSRLNRRQSEVLTLVAQGLSYKEIGARIHISPRTVRYHMAKIINLLHLENRTQVLAYAGRLGLREEIP